MPAVALLLSALVAGCGEDDSPSGGDDEKATGVPVFFVDESGKLTPLDQPVDGVDQMRPMGRTLAAVKALVTVTPGKDTGLLSHWGSECGQGAGVDQLEHQGGLVTIKVSGVAGGACSRKGPKEAQQRQQLAWTVVENLEIPETTPIRVLGPNGSPMWGDFSANEKALAR